MPGPKFSIVTPSFNSIKTIQETIDSVKTQDFKDWEHLIIDGGSKDGTIELVKSYPYIKWISEKDEGHYHAMNKGVERATGEIILILNSDDCLRPGVLRKVAESFDQHPDWDAAFGDIIFVDGCGKEIYRRQEARYDYDILRFSGICYVIHQTLFIKRPVHDRIGMYRHKQFLNSCDYDLILRLGQARLNVGHVPEYIVNYRYHDHGQSADMRVTRNMLKESTLICREHGRPDGVAGKALRAVMRAKRQIQKLIYRGQCDLIPGTWRLRKHMKAKTTFASNSGVDKL